MGHMSKRERGWEGRGKGRGGQKGNGRDSLCLTNFESVLVPMQVSDKAILRHLLAFTGRHSQTS